MTSGGSGLYVVGRHVCKGRFADISDAIIANITAAPSTSTQIFTHGPHSTRANNINVAAVNALSKYIKIFVHEPYRIHIFNGNEDMMRAMVDVFKVAAACGSSGVVIHLPRATVNVVVKNVSKLIELLDKEMITVPIVLETPSNVSHPTMSWESPEKIRRLDDALNDAKIDASRVGICIDTAHIFAGGADIRSRKNASQYLRELPIARIHLFHLNGNEYEGRGGDKHAIPLSPLDKIWGGKKYMESGCFEFIEWARAYDIPVIFEDKPHHDQNDIYKFINMCGRT